MSADSAWDVQTGVFLRLTGTPAVTGLLAGGANGVFDHVPAGSPFPYIVIGEMRSRPLDTQGVSGNEVFLTLHAYSRGAGMKETKQIMSAVYDALHHAAFTVPNQTLVLSQAVDSEVSLEGDGLTRHGIRRFHIITEPV
jgi:hypothetical protein